MRDTLLLLLMLALVVVPPLVLAAFSPRRGVRQGRPARRPFRVPGPWGRFVPLEDRSDLEEVDLPPVTKSRARRGRRHGRKH
ncbi:MAG: hypothetical protein ACRDYU_14570 [Actinomycetes bacterium]